jgi:iron complex outermembrane receptor protein
MRSNFFFYVKNKEKLMRFLLKLSLLSIFFVSALIFCFERPTLAQSEDVLETSFEEIDVRGTVRREELESTSAVTLQNKDVYDRIYLSPLYMLRQTPGVRVNEFSEQGVAVTVQIRGMGGGHGGDIGFYLDGIPLNDNGHGDNYSDTTILIPLEVESLEVMKGPVSVLYGKGNGAGTAAYQSIKTGNFTRLLLKGGSYGFYDASGIIARDQGKLHHVYAFQGFHTDNSWRENSEWDRTNLSARWTYDVTNDFVVSLNLRAAISKWNNSRYAANWLPVEKAPDDGSGLGSGNSHRDRYDARLWANYLISPESQLTYYFYATKLENNMAELEYPALGPGNQRLGDDAGGDQIGKRDAFGNGLSYNYNDVIFGDHDFSLTVGLDYLYEKQKRDEYGFLWGSGPKHTSHVTDAEFSLKTWSFFGEAIYEAFEDFKVRLGGRYDKITGKVRTGPFHESSPNMEAEGTNIGFFSPKVGVSYSLTDYLELYANYGKGFNLPGVTNLRYFTMHQLKSTVREQYEIGFRAAPFAWLELGSSYYFAMTTNDIQRNPETNEFENIGETRKQGIETYLKLFPIDNLTIYADFSYQDAKYKINPASLILEGRRITGIPRYIFNAEVAYEPPEGLGGRATYNWTGNMLRTDDPSRAIYKVLYAHDQGSVDLQLNYRFSPSVKLSLDLLNAFNERPVQGTPNAAGYFTYAPVAPMTAYLTLELNFD